VREQVGEVWKAFVGKRLLVDEGVLARAVMVNFAALKGLLEGTLFHFRFRSLLHFGFWISLLWLEPKFRNLEL